MNYYGITIDETLSKKAMDKALRPALMMVGDKANIINENTIIFAHSIAPIFICKFLVENKIKVKRLVFVCGFNNYLEIDKDYDAVNESMYFDNLTDVKDYCDDIVCFYSGNDPYVKYEV